MKIMLREEKSRVAIAGLLFGVLALVFQISVAGATPLDDRIKAFQDAPKQTENEVLAVLKAGLSEDRSARAFAVVRSWLSKSPTESTELLFAAAQSSEFAGEWEEAVGFYRKLVRQPSLDAGKGLEAVPAIYRLLINQLENPEVAYLLMKEEGNRLRKFGHARQFDGWFLDRAFERSDFAAIASRLGAVYDQEGALTFYEPYLSRLFQSLETFNHNSEELLKALDELARAKRTDARTKARCAWIKEILPLAARMAELTGAKRKIGDSSMDQAMAAAKTLVETMPYEGSISVARGWMHYNAGDSGVFRRFVEPRREEKAAPILAALPKLSVEQMRNVIGLKVREAKDRTVAGYLLSLDEVRQLVVKFPAVFNTLEAPDVPLFDKTLTPELAVKMAPNLQRNPHEQAAMVRMWAGTERRFSVAVDNLIASEMWRFDDLKKATHGLWHSGMYERDVKYEAPLKKHAKLSDQYQTLKKAVGSKASGKDRMAAFDTLRKDLLSSAPKIPGSLLLWDELFEKAPDPDTIAMLRAMVGKTDGQEGIVLKRALDKVVFGKSGRLPWRATVQTNHYRYHQQPTRKAAPDFIAELGNMVKTQSTAGKLSPVIFGMWLHSVDARKPESQALMKSLVASPGYAKLPVAYRISASDSNHFGVLAMDAEVGALDSSYLCRDLTGLPETPSPQAIEEALKKAVQNIEKAPKILSVVGLKTVGKSAEWTPATRNLLLSLFRQNTPLGRYPSSQGYEEVVIRLAKDWTENKQWKGLERFAPGLWLSAVSYDHPRSAAAQALAGLGEEFQKEGESSLAVSYSRAALRGVAGKNLFNQTGHDIPKIAERVRAVSGKSVLAIGAIEIPVDPGDPAYPIYQSNAEFVQGNLDSAWELYLKGGDQLNEVLRETSPEYGFWLLEKNTEAENTALAEELVKQLTIWSRQAAGTFSSQQEAELKVLFADLAYLKGALPTARAYYRRVADAKEYQGTEIGLRAALGSVKVDRSSKNFGAAMTELDKLMRIKEVSLRNRVRYARAEVFMDQESYKEGLDEIEKVLLQEPKHPDALILRGKIHNEMRKLVEASEIELGPSQDDTVIVPGETVKINLRDPTLRVSGVGADIEVEIWAKSGDRERVMLYQLGDNKEKFRAEVPTALGPPVAGDKVLQILGNDEIRFGYSKRFRAKMDDLPADPSVVIGVASDADLALTAGAFPPREGERRLDIEELGLSTAQAALGTRSVRPGNPVYLRVNDPDQSTTPGIDEIFVTLTASSGDEIRRLALRETGPFTGEFQAVVPTAGAQALAFASESAPGRDPNMAISSKNYPGWLGKVVEEGGVPVFGVDLNDNVALDTLIIGVGENGQHLTRFVLQTSLNGKNWTTRFRYPAGEDVSQWDGSPQVTSIPTYRGGIPIPEAEGRELPEEWREAMELGSAKESCKFLSAPIPKLLAGELPIVDTGHPDYPGLLRYRALFYQPNTAVRRFKLTGLPPGTEKEKAQTIFLIDGKPASEDSEDPMMIERELGPGVHEIEIWRHEGRAGLIKRQPVIHQEVDGQEELVPCPDDMFDPKTFPETAQAEVPRAAAISKTSEGFVFQFYKQTRARLFRVVIAGFDGVAPSIGKVSLTNRDGEKLLPVAGDFMALRANDSLEVLPGDRITARYEDPVSATPKRNRHQRSLTVAFNNAEISASFLNYEMTDEGRVLVLEPIRRFRFDDAVAIIIDDPDMDSSPKKDIVECRVTTGSGGEAVIKVVETEEHSGRFLGRIFPVEGEPSRASEIKMSKGDALTATYRDTENLEPGIPCNRTVVINHAVYQDPAMMAYTVESQSIEAPEEPAKKDNAIPGSRRLAPEIIHPRRELNYRAVEGDGEIAGVVGANLNFDVVVPHRALAGSSEIRAYVQTDAARQAAGGDVKKPFDIGVPGTMKLTGSLSRPTVEAPSGYLVGTGPRGPGNEPPLEEGRFSFSVPLILGDLPERSFANKAAESLPSSAIPDGLVVKAGDLVHLGYPYKDADGAVKWKMARCRVGSHGFLDVMDNNYNQALESSFVGEKIYVRVVDRGLDRTAARDTASVTLKSTSGTTTSYQLTETEPHSGIFKGVFALSYSDKAPTGDLPLVALNGFPVRYGDNVTISYETKDGVQSKKVTVNKGADGLIEPFTKRFTGDEMAVRTSFTLAECLFELAKKHREMEQESLARREMAHAQKLLAEAVATHRDDEMKAHAEYLLGNLAQEYADLSKNDEAKMPMYQDALSRFAKIPGDYPETEFAPKAQFKTALVYEKMGEFDNAVEEYVKLAYKYPDDELIPEVMSRLGGYFQKKGLAFKKQADPLREKEDDASKAEVLRLDGLAYPEFLNAAMVFAKLEERFPDDKLAGLAGLRAAQNYMRAMQYGDAIARFEKVYDNEKYAGGEIRGQAMYWCGLSYERLEEPQLKEAYQLYRRVTFDFQDSKWAKYARGRLADPAFARIIELERIERERMIEALKESRK